MQSKTVGDNRTRGQGDKGIRISTLSLSPHFPCSPPASAAALASSPSPESPRLPVRPDQLLMTTPVVGGLDQQAGYNAGSGNALKGWRDQGNVDFLTAGRD